MILMVVRHQYLSHRFAGQHFERAPLHMALAAIDDYPVQQKKMHAHPWRTDGPEAELDSGDVSKPFFLYQVHS
jgi:hypothetical protein